MKSSRSDGRGHWPRGKRRNAASVEYLTRIRKVMDVVRKYCDSDLPRYSAWSRRSVARHLDVSDRTIRRWLAGEDLPNPRHFNRLCRLVENPNRLR